MHEQFLGEMPNTARLWLFPLREALSGAASTNLENKVSEFISGWQAHKHQLLAAGTVLQGQIIVVAVDEAKVLASGCSIDALTRAIEQIAGDEGADIVRSAEVLFERGGRFHALPRADFQTLVNRGEVGPGTTVLDNTIANAGELRAGLWRKPLKDSWHAKAFPAEKI